MKETNKNGLLSENVEEFLKEYYSRKAMDSINLLAQSGSSRKYYRFYHKEESFILTESSNLEENKTFLYFTEHFSKIINNLPTIKKVADDFSLYVQSDLGDVSLMDLLEKDKENSKIHFENAIKKLVQMQVLGHQNLDYSQCFSYPKFNSLVVLRDLFSFKNYFLNLIGIEFNHGKLLMDFERFAHDFEKITFQYFVFRDFQSRNIMIFEDKPYFIDYQGGLQGPPQYDLVSLIWQAKANLPPEWKQDFYTLYFNEFKRLTSEGIDEKEFQSAYELCLIERLLQVLGTYGFRGIYERKPHFLSSITFALKNLAGIQHLKIVKNYPELYKIIQKLTNLQFTEN